MAPWGPEQDQALRRLAESNARLEEAAQMLRDVQRELEEARALRRGHVPDYDTESLPPYLLAIRFRTCS